MKALKWVGIAVGCLIVLIVAALLIIPFFVDLNDYKPEIERRVAEATGRSFSIGGDIDLSLFPWAGVALADLRLGSPPGFDEADMIRLEAFEVRVKLLPLILRQIQVKRFVVQRPQIVLVRQKDGKANWQGLGGGAETGAKRPADEAPKSAPSSDVGQGLPIESLAVGEFAVENGSIRYLDRQKGAENNVDDLTLRLTDVSLEQPVPVFFSATVDGRRFSLEGSVGPIGRQPGQGSLPFDLVVKAMDSLQAALQGQVTDAASNPQVDMILDVSPFSPRALAASVGRPFPIETRDPDALKRVSLKTGVTGGAASLSLTDGRLALDDSTATFSARASEFERPRLSFQMQLDRLDLDRYLPPEREGAAQTEEKGEKGEPKAADKPDYTPLRRLVLDGSVNIGRLKAAGATMEDIRVTVSAKNGVIRVDPLALAMYGGDVSGGLNLDVRTDTPKSALNLGVAQLAVNPLLNDLLQKDFIEGLTSASIDLSFAGDSAGDILETLTGGGELRFEDGAVKGIDLAAMARNIQSAFGGAAAGGEKPRTDFTELTVPFSLKNGVAQIPGAVLKSPFIRLKAEGTADLVGKTLDVRVDPKLVGTIKGQGDTAERAGLEVPIAVSGSFSSPKFAPDLERAARKKMEDLTGEGLQRLAPRQGQTGGPGAKPGEQIKDLIKGLPFGGKN